MGMDACPCLHGQGWDKMTASMCVRDAERGPSCTREGSASVWVHVVVALSAHISGYHRCAPVAAGACCLHRLAALHQWALLAYVKLKLFLLLKT